MAPATVDDLRRLFELLAGAVTGSPPNERLTLDAALLPAAGELVSHLGLTTLTLDQRPGVDRMVTLDASAGTVTAIAQGTLFPGGPAPLLYLVEITGRYTTQPVLTLDARPQSPGAWGFAGDFPAFPPFLGQQDLQLAWLDSFLPDAAFEQPSFVVVTAGGTPAPGLWFDGILDLAASRGALADLAHLFTPSRLPIDGRVTVRPGSFPLLDLSADPRYSIPGLVDVAVALRAEEEPRAQGGQTALELVGVPPIGSGFDDIEISAPLLQSPYAWVLTATTTDPDAYSVGRGLETLSRYASGQPLSLPSGFDALSAMYLERVVVGLAPSTTPAVDLIGFRIATDPRRRTLWRAPILGLAVESLAVQWDVVGLAGARPSLLATLSGVLRVEADPASGQPQPARLGVAVDLSGLSSPSAPDVGISVELDRDTPLSAGALLRTFTGAEIDLGLLITDLRVEARTGPRTLQFVAGLTTTWRLPVPLSLDAITLSFLYAPNSFTATIGAQVTIVGLGFLVGSTYRGEGAGWAFSGQLLPASQGTSLDDVLATVAPGWFPARLPANLGAIELRDVAASFDTLTSAYSFDGVLGWPFELDGWKVDLEAQLSLQKASSTTPVAGFVRGRLQLDGFSTAVVYAFEASGSSTIAFEIAWRGMTLTCVYATNARRERIIRANLGGVSFGDLLGWLVGLALDGEEYRLPAPWDVLYKLRFDDLWLELNLTTKAIGAEYRPRVDLGLVRLDAIALTYRRRAGEPSIVISIEGEFLGTRYPAGDRLTWDLLNDPAPTPPGRGEQLLDLRYLGLGQNVAFRDSGSFGSVREAITALERDLVPVDGAANPLVELPALKFSGDGRWLIGADFTVMSAVSIAGVFADPALYGLRIGLAGERVRALAGLQFEILYKKVTDTVGVYHVELTLPEAMRQLQFGAVAVTVPVVGIDVYTNGNFRLDFGFPAKRDWSRSFSLQAGPFVGYGGFYLALLDGETSTKVPAVRNGSFSPVIEFGIGISAGLGRTFEKGVLRAGATITLEAIVEGVLAWFNPQQSGAGSDLFYRVQGTAAIVGKVFGEVDFVVVKARISLVASASVTLTIESYAPIAVALNVSVEVSASIEVLFFTISFSFKTSLDLSFTIGSASQPPWLRAAEDPSARPLRLRQQRSQHRVAPPTPRAVLALLRESGGEQPEFDWEPRPPVGGPVEITLLLVPSLTPARTPGAQAPAVQIAMSLLVPNSVQSGARHADEVLRVDRATAGRQPFDLLAAGVLRWAIGALRTRQDSGAGAGERVTIADLDAIAAFLADRVRRDETFTYERVRALVEQRFHLRISNPIGTSGALFDAGSDSPRAPGAAQVQGAAFPMIPELLMAPRAQPVVAFWKRALANGDYRAQLERYYDQLRTRADGDDAVADGPRGLASGALEPVSGTVFADWFALLAQQGIALAADLLDGYPYEPSGSESLREVADGFEGLLLEQRTRPGDSVATVAAAFGQTPAALRAANPWLAGLAAEERLPEGSTVRVEAGPTPATIAAANRDYPLRPGGRLTIAGVRRQIAARDTLASLAEAFSLSSPAAVAIGDGSGAAAANATNAGLLAPGATLVVPPFEHVVTAADVGPADAVDRIAAVFFVRARQRQLDAAAREQIAWYVAAIGQLNPSFSGSVRIPVAALDADGRIVDSGTHTTWSVRPGDDVAQLAAVFALLQLAPRDPVWTAFRAKVTTSPPPLAPGSVVRLPSLTLTLQAGDTLAGVATAFLTPPGASPEPLPLPPAVVAAIARLADANGPSALLAPRSVLALPPLPHAIAAGETLAGVAERYDLTLEELAESVAEDRGILTPYDGGRRLTVPHVAARELDALIDDLSRFGSFNALSATASRFLLAGMRAPLPGPTGAPAGGLRGLADVVGQQFPAPGPTTVPYDVAFSNGTGVSWLSFEAPPGERATARERAQRAGDGPRGSDGTVVSLSPQFLEQHRPEPRLDPLTVTGPLSMRAYEEVAPRYAIERSVPWQTAEAIALPGPTGATGRGSGTAGGPSLWMLPQTLRSAVAAGATGPTATTPPYGLRAAAQAPDGREQERALERWSWAAAIPLQVARARDGAGAPLEGAYEVAGADPAARQTLLDAWSCLEGLPRAAGDRLYLLHGVGSAGENDRGLVSAPLAPGRTFVLRTNLSTQTHGGAPAGGELLSAAGAYYARVEALGPFLKTLWEGVVSGSGGFHLTYADSAGRGLPDELFGDSGTTTLWAVLLLDRQSRQSAPERGLHRFNNCAVVAENLDASAASVFARPLESPPTELRRVAAMPPGVVGFGLARRNPIGPSGGPPPGPTGMTRQLHSLLGYQVQQSGDFAASDEALPIGPQDEPPSWLRLPPGPTHAYWSYAQTVPVAQFGVVNDAPAVEGLPQAAANPYRGITGPTGPGGRPLSSVRLGFAFHDLYGNTTDATDPPRPLEVPVGYTDELIAPSAWPGAGFAYRFVESSGPGGVELELSAGYEPGRCVAGGGLSPAQALRAATADAERYRQLWFQLQQRDVRFALGSNLGAANAPDGELRALLTAFVTKAKLFADSAASARQVTAPTVAGAALAAFAEQHATTPGLLATANADVDAAALFPATYVKPRVLAAPAMNTLAALAREVVGRGGSGAAPDCAAVATPDASCTAATPPLRVVGRGEESVAGPAARSTGSGTPAGVARENATRPLTPGLVLRTRARTSAPLTAPQAAGDLDAVAAALATTVYALVADPRGTAGEQLEAGLVHDNWAAAGLIADGVAVRVGEFALRTNGDSFKSLYDWFADPARLPDLTRADLAGALRTVAGLLRAGATVALATLLVPQPPPSSGPAPAAPRFALADLPAGSGTVEELADLNAAQPNLFALGTPLLLGWSCCQAPAGTSLRRLAEQAGLPLGALAEANATTRLGGGIELTLPDLTVLADPAARRTAYAPTADASLATIAQKLEVTPDALAALNRQLPGIFRTGAAVVTGSGTVAATAADTLQSLFARSGSSSWTAFVSALQQPANAGIFRPQGAFVTPLPRVPVSAGVTPPVEELAGRLNVDAVALLTVNRSARGVVRNGAKVLGPPHEGTVPTVIAGPFDSVETVLRRLSRPGVPPLTIAGLIAANSGRTDLLAPGAALLLPPGAARLTFPFAPKLPPEGAAGEQRIAFPVEVWLELSRAEGLLHPDFRAVEGVGRVRSGLAPRLASGDAAQLSLDAFAETFERAFAPQRLKCAVAASERIWAVDFGAGGVSRFAVDPSQPAFYALAPLSTEPVGGDLAFPSYVSGRGLCEDLVKRYENVDLDGWMRELLDAVDLALTPSYAVPAFGQGPPGSVPAALPRPHAPQPAIPPLPQRAAAERDPLAGPVGLATAARQSRPELRSLAAGGFAGLGATGCSGPTASGPLDYDRLVAAKGGLARALRQRVEPIVAAPGATAHHQLDAARETLYQQLLVRLGDAYDVSAVVQFPVDVVSPVVAPPPGVTGQSPPRLSGKVVPVLRTVPPVGTDGAEAADAGAGPPPASFAAVADGYGVSAAYLAQVAGNLQGLLRPGVVVVGERVRERDTVNSVAERIGVPTDPARPGYWELWAPFVDGFADADVLNGGASFPLTVAARIAGPGESLSALGEFFDRDVASVGRANARRPATVRTGALTVPGYAQPYVVAPSDSLQAIAAGISAANPASPPLTLDALCRVLADRRDLLRPGTSLAIVEELPELSLSTSKVTLGRFGSASGPPPLSFLLTVKQVAQRAKLLLNLDFAITELEHEIANVPGAGSYQASSWLTFVRGFDGLRGSAAGVETAIPQVQVPIPLRAYPPPSLLTAQSGLAATEGATTIAQARGWDYRFDVQTRKAAQDTDHLRVVFGERAAPFGAPAVAWAKLLRWLAAFADAAPALRDDLARLPALAPGAQDPVAAHAVQALATIAAGVAGALAASAEEETTGAAAAADLYAYRMTTLTDGSQLQTLRLVPETPLAGERFAVDGPAGLGVWPLVYVQSPTARAGGGPDDGFVELTGSGGDYTYPSGFRADEQQTYRFRFPQRDVILNSTGRGAIAVTRNDRLIPSGPLGPTGPTAAVPTTPAFVYRTPYAQFGDPLVPLLEADEAIDVSALGGGGGTPRPLVDHLLAILAAATDVAPGASARGAQIELLCAYGFVVAGDMIVRTPVRLVPSRTIAGGDVRAFAAALAGSLVAWHAETDVDPGGMLAFDLSVFAQDDGGDAAPPRPILRLRDLRLPFAAIAWPAITGDPSTTPEEAGDEPS